MADEAFALSPISARAAQPSEADYDAIQEAFMETSRGRWFLGEYAKRNRNADTKMVLDAVARIEGALAAQKQPEPEPEPEPDPLPGQMLASFRAALNEARQAATTAVGDLALEQNLAPVRKGARVIREIAWRLREIGADGRICDLIDSQVGVIESAAGKLNSADLAAALHGAFDRIEEKIAGFDVDGAAAASAPVAAAQTAAHAEKPAAVSETAPASSSAQPVEAAAAHPAAPVETSMAEAEAAPMAEAESEPADAFGSSDEAMLDMVAMEMAAPDTDAAYDPTLEENQTEENRADASQTDETPISVAAYEIDVTFPDRDTADEPITASALPVVTPLQSALKPATEPEPIEIRAAEPELAETKPAEPDPAFAASLGSSLLANGIVTRPRSSRPDPLAPIRRMSQTEKIAFFS
jgi:hypothetical protein